MLNYATRNRQEWAERGMEITKEMLENIEGELQGDAASPKKGQSVACQLGKVSYESCGASVSPSGNSKELEYRNKLKMYQMDVLLSD